MNKDEKIYKHPSYGIIGFSRRQGNPGPLFGSPLASHETYICLKIARAEFIRDDRDDRFFGSMRGDLIEVYLSAAQFSELLTTMNIGMGVPCTVRSINGQVVEDPPKLEHETEKFRTTFKKGVDNLVKDCESYLIEIQTLLEKNNLTKADKKSIVSKFEHVLTEVRSNAPYLVELFQEVTEKVVVHAKAEVDSFVTSNIVAAGIKTILSAASEKQAPSLPPAEED